MVLVWPNGVSMAQWFGVSMAQWFGFKAGVSMAQWFGFKAGVSMAQWFGFKIVWLEYNCTRPFKNQNTGSLPKVCVCP